MGPFHMTLNMEVTPASGEDGGRRRNKVYVLVSLPPVQVRPQKLLLWFSPL